MSKYFKIIKNNMFGHNLAEFDMFSRNFDMNNPEIHEKLFHTFKVAEMAYDIANALNENSELAFNIGIFHDFSRFEQWTKYNSFKDHLGFDHGDKAAEILFGITSEDIDEFFEILETNKTESNKISKKEIFVQNALNNGKIKDFYLNPDDFIIAYLSVKFHNKAQIDVEYIKKFMKAFNEDKYSLEQIITQCKIIRDADKMDLFNRIGYGNLEFYTDIDSAETDKFGNQPDLVTLDHVLNNLKEHKYVDIKFIRTKLDRVLSFVGFLYDLNFQESVNQINLNAYFESLKSNYGSKLIPESQAILNQAIEDAKLYFEEKQNQQQPNK